MRARVAFDRLAASSPSSLARPESGRTMPISILMAVDLPAPLRPSRP